MWLYWIKKKHFIVLFFVKLIDNQYGFQAIIITYIRTFLKRICWIFPVFWRKIKWIVLQNLLFLSSDWHEQEIYALLIRSCDLLSASDWMKESPSDFGPLLSHSYIFKWFSTSHQAVWRVSWFFSSARRLLSLFEGRLSRAHSLTDGKHTLNGEPLWHNSSSSSVAVTESKKATKGLKRANKAFSHGQTLIMDWHPHIVRASLQRSTVYSSPWWGSVLFKHVYMRKTLRWFVYATSINLIF